MELSKKGKYRFIAFCIIIALSCIHSVAYTYNIYGVMNSVGDTTYAHDVTFDGEDFTPFFALSEVMLNGVMALLTTVIYIVLDTVGNALAFLILYLIAVKNASHISAREISLTQKIIWSFLIVSFGLAIVLTKWDFALTALLLFWQMPVAANLIYLLGLKLRYKKIQQLG